MARPSASGIALVELITLISPARKLGLVRLHNAAKRIAAIGRSLILLLVLCHMPGANAQQSGSINVALAANGGVASASSTYTATGVAFPVSAVNDGDRAGFNWGQGGGWNDGTGDTFPDWVQINFNTQKNIDRVVVYTLQDNYASPVDPPDTLTFALYGITAFQVQGWNGAAWVNLGAAVVGNNLVKRAVTFPAFTARRIRVNITGALDSYSRITEIEAWTVGPTTAALTSSVNPSTVGTGVNLTATVTGAIPTGTVNFLDGSTSIAGCAIVSLTGGGNSPTANCTTGNLSVGTHSLVATYSGDAANGSSSSAVLSQIVYAPSAVNIALASNGGIASASSTYSAAYGPAGINDNERAGIHWANGGGWNDNTYNSFPDWAQINFTLPQLINKVVVYTVQDNYASPVEPTDTLTFTQWGVTAFAVQGWNGTAWVDLATVGANNIVKRTVNFSAYTTDRIRINVTNGAGGYSRLTEVEAWTTNPDQAPAVALTAPASNSVFTQPATIALAATATDSDGTVSKVEFYQGASLLGTVTTGGTGNSGSSYNYIWGNLAAGTYSLTAKAYDNLGTTSTSGAVNMTVCGPPAVSITAPAAGQRTTPPGTFALAVTASTPAACGSVTQVDYFNGATPIGTSTTPPSFNASWSNVPTGGYSLTANAHGANGLIGTSSAVNVTVDMPPTVTLTAPANNAQLTTPGPFSLVATAGDTDGNVTRVDFLANGSVIGTKTGSPYTFSWPGTAGSYTLTARATDNLGGVTTSTAASVVVANPPTATLTSPTLGQFVVPNAAVTFAASCTVDSAHGRSISSLLFVAKNSAGTQVWSATTFGGCGPNAPYTASWTPTTSGVYTVTATVTDSRLATGISPAVTFTVDVRPTVGVTSDKSSYLTPATVQLTATATDTDGTVQSVIFYSGGSQIGTGTPGGSNTYLLTWANNVAGTYSVTAKATDNLSGNTTSTPLTISIVQTGPTIVYYHNDFEGSPLAATDAQGDVVWLETYAPYGERYLNQDTTTRNGVWYNGKPTEDSSGLSYYGGRWYNSVMGRFYSVDPQRFRDDNPLSFNRYAYANNNPYRFIDPNGHSPIDIGFLIWDIGKLGVALYDGSGAGGAAIDVGISAIAVIVPIPGSGLAIKAARTAKAVITEAAKVEKSGTALARELGEAGEAMSGIAGPKSRIPSTTGSAKYRVPDFLDSEVLREAKNRSELRWTNQLEDFARFAQDNRLQFIIDVRTNTKISPRAQSMIDRFNVEIREIYPARE